MVRHAINVFAARTRWLCKRARIPLLALLITSIAFLSLTPVGRANVRAALLVTDVVSNTSHSFLRLTTRPSLMETVAIPTSSVPTEAQLYRPDDHSAHGAIVLVLGYPSDIHDSQASRLAESMARLGIVVLVPQLRGLRIGLLVQEDVEILISAFEWLSTRPDVASSHIGFAGFCVGSSLALVAAEDPRINTQVALVSTLGGYYDLRDFLRATAANSSRYKDHEHSWQPSETTVELFVQNALHYDTNPTDKVLLSRRFTSNVTASQAPSRLSSFGDLIYALLTTTDPKAVDALLAQMPTNTLHQMARVSPSTDIHRLKAKIFVIHDPSDPYVPVTESYRLTDAIANPTQKIYSEFAIFDHVRPTRLLPRIAMVWEGMRLSMYLSQVLIEIMPNS